MSFAQFRSREKLLFLVVVVAVEVVVLVGVLVVIGVLVVVEVVFVVAAVAEIVVEVALLLIDLPSESR